MGLFDEDDDVELPDVGYATSAPYSNDTTSKWAAQKILPYVRGQRERVVRILAREGDHGATDQEMQVGWGKHPESQRPRRIELVEMGIVIESGKYRPTGSGNDATVWILNPDPDEDRIRKWIVDQKMKGKTYVLGATTAEERAAVRNHAGTWKIQGPLKLSIYVSGDDPLLEHMVGRLESDPNPCPNQKEFVRALRELQRRVKAASDFEVPKDEGAAPAPALAPTPAPPKDTGEPMDILSIFESL